jgi:hypothetical protein
MNAKQNFLIGEGVDPDKFKLLVIYHPPNNEFSPEEHVTVQRGEGRHADGPTPPPRRIMDYRPHVFMTPKLLA